MEASETQALQPGVLEVVRQEEWMESGGQEVGKGDGCGHGMRLLKLNPNPKMFGRGSRRGGHFERPEWSRLQHLDSDLGFQFSGNLETNKDALDCIALDWGQQKAHK